MHAAVMAHLAGRDAVIMSAAVADYTPAEQSPHKVKKDDGPVTITLKRTKDILAELGKLPSRKQRLPVLVGFAAETRDVVTYAQRKLKQKDVDLIVANDVSRTDAGFDVDTNAVTLVWSTGTEELPLQTKSAVAATILDRIEQFLAAVPAPNAALKA
jgi:phosphopantothenoylcysteine decarboxylase/phosphopantothenate--cysteine ligase